MTGKISRRTMLRGAAGAIMGLPLLDAMTPSARAAATSKATSATRLAVLYFANGVNADAWTPKGAGRDFELSPSLTPLAQFKNDILVFTELMNQGSIGGDGHYVKTAGFLTGTTITKTTGKDLRSGGVSMDQLAAQRVGRETPLPSLELGIEPVTNFVDNNVGYTALYGSHIAWATPTTPISKEINPRLAFDRLFRSSGTSSPQDDRSILDLVADDAKSLRANVGHNDQVKLDEYFDAVRAVEKRIEFNTRARGEENGVRPEALAEIEALDKRIAAWGDSPQRDKMIKNVRRSGDHTEHVRLMLDLMVLAFWTDTTRVSTFMFGNAVSPKNFSFLDGVKGGHHEISHHKNDKNTLAMYQRINQWHVEQYAYMLAKLAAIKEGERSLLENSMILFGSGMRDGNSHNPRNLPLVLAGKAGGAIKPGRHLVFKKNTPLCNLYCAMLDRMGAPVKHFGDSTEIMKGLDDPTYAGDAV